LVEDDVQELLPKVREEACLPRHVSQALFVLWLMLALLLDALPQWFLVHPLLDRQQASTDMGQAR
jgi:hypothetical protein